MAPVPVSLPPPAPVCDGRLPDLRTLASVTTRKQTTCRANPACTAAIALSTWASCPGPSGPPQYQFNRRPSACCTSGTPTPEKPGMWSARPGQVATPSMSAKDRPASATASPIASRASDRAERSRPRPTADCPTPDTTAESSARTVMRSPPGSSCVPLRECGLGVGDRQGRLGQGDVLGHPLEDQPQRRPDGQPLGRADHVALRVEQIGQQPQLVLLGQRQQHDDARHLDAGQPRLD